MTLEEERDAALNELARLRAGLTAGLTPEQSARLAGTTPEELEADAQAFAVELGAAAPPSGTSRSGGARGTDVPSNGARTVSGGAARYRERHGLDDDGRRPERRQVASDDRNPFRTHTHTWER
ncbi:hypothetical protein [Streptomyces sp. NPDC087317]|uniref:hypothetical protein n=1 Tax=Streptomyces sp. NPDC087317 TaxID=3365784 RepID=UPI00382D99AD